MYKSIKLFLLLVFFTYSLICACTAVHAAVIAPNEHLWIRAGGTYLKTSPCAKNPNVPYMPVGIAYFHIYDSSNSQELMKYMPYYIRNMKMNCIRFCFEAGPKRGHITTDCLPSEFLWGPFGARAFVDLCKQASVYVMLDAHHSMGDNSGDASTLWSAHPEVLQNWIDDWKLTAAEFKDEPWVIGYEMLNECTPSFGNTPAYIKQAYVDCAAGIRTVDAKHVIFFGCGNWNSPSNCDSLWGSNIIPGGNVAVAAHYYCTYAYSDPNIEDKVKAFSDKWNIPFIIGEFEYGSSSGWLSKDIATYGGNRMLALMRERKGGYFEWLAKSDEGMPNLWNEGRMDLWQDKIAADATPNPEPAAILKFMNPAGDFTAGLAEFAPGSSLGVQFEAVDISAGTADTLQIELHGQAGAGYLNDAETVTLTETGLNTGIFRGTIPTASGAVAVSSNNTVEVRTGNAETVTASYGPYISTITKSNLTPLPVASIQLEVTCKGIGWPNKMQADGTTPGKVRAVLKDATGEVARWAAGAVTFSISPAYAYIVGRNPVTPVDGVAETAICSAESGGGNCTLTASGNGTSASASIDVVDYWHDMRVQKQDASWSNANGDVVITDSATPKCIAVMENISGLQAESEGYEYSTDGGLNWSGITEDFTSAVLDPAKWAVHGDASKAPGSNGVRLNTSAVNKHGELEYVSGIPSGLKNWRLRAVFGVRNLTLSVPDANTEFNINFYTQDDYSSYIPQEGYQLSLQYISNSNYCYPKLYRVSGGARVFISSSPGFCRPLYKETPQWKMTVNLAFHDGTLEMGLDDDFFKTGGGYLTAYLGATSTLKGFSFSGKTGTANMPEHWIYGIKMHNYLPSMPYQNLNYPMYNGYISTVAKTTDNIPFTAGPVGTNRVKFIHYTLDDTLLGNERSRTFVVNLNGSNDTTPPSTVVTVRDGLNQDISETNKSTQLSANWAAATDAESGISRYWFAVSATPGNADIVPWTSNGTRNYVTTRGLALNVGTTYYISVKAENGSGAQGTAATSDGQFPTVDLYPPEITNVSARPSPTAAVVTWDTDEQSTSKVEYGLTAAYGTLSDEDTNRVVSHSVTLPGLLPNMVYHYRVLSKDSSGNEGLSSDGTFSTSGAAIKAYPNPHDFTSGNPMTFAGTDNTGIEVKIFTISGRLVRKLSASNGTSIVTWNGKNEDGEKVRRGLYMAKVTSGSGASKICKIALIK
ncbi:MAG: hypothetical protein A2297_01075 [Elusimicrobia bacterium RIFOXYB2_FULL_48_7]|nr:MAG: hypothetical protein A2297_01075 [Elusimicrobia bacterium RIFOXYB2_FULL_48_7]